MAFNSAKAPHIKVCFPQTSNSQVHILLIAYTILLIFSTLLDAL